jgi:hypothetical protein
LKKTDPVPDEYDVVWHGPYHVPRSRQWNPSHFMLYGGKLFCTLNYLKVSALAYDAAFPKTRNLSAFSKYKRWADTRHGGMLDLPREDSGAFSKWFHSDVWQGTHPWENMSSEPAVLPGTRSASPTDSEYALSCVAALKTSRLCAAKWKEIL